MCYVKISVSKLTYFFPMCEKFEIR